MTKLDLCFWILVILFVLEFVRIDLLRRRILEDHKTLMEVAKAVLWLRKKIDPEGAREK